MPKGKYGKLIDIVPPTISGGGEWYQENKFWIDPLYAAANFGSSFVSGDYLGAASAAIEYVIGDFVDKKEADLQRRFEQEDQKRKTELALLKSTDPYLWAQLIEQEKYGGEDTGSLYSIRTGPNGGPSAAWEWSMGQADENYFNNYLANLPPVGSLDPNIQQINQEAEDDKENRICYYNFKPEPCREEIPFPDKRQCYNEQWKTFDCPEGWNHPNPFQRVCKIGGVYYPCGEEPPDWIKPPIFVPVTEPATQPTLPPSTPVTEPATQPTLPPSTPVAEPVIEPAIPAPTTKPVTTSPSTTQPTLPPSPAPEPVTQPLPPSPAPTQPPTTCSYHLF